MQMLAVLKIHDSHNAAERHRPVRGGERIHVKYLTISSRPAVKLFPVPGRDAAVRDSNVKLGLPFWNPGAGTEEHRRKSVQQGLIRSRRMGCHRQHLFCWLR